MACLRPTALFGGFNNSPHRFAAAASCWSCALFTRAASGGRRNFLQRIDEQHLASDLDNIGLVARGDSPNPQPFAPQGLDSRTNRCPHRRQNFDTPADNVDGHKPFGSKDFGKDFDKTNRRKPWMHYESMRGVGYPNGEGKKGPQRRDLTHSEVQRLQEMALRKRMLDRKLMWLKIQHLPNPQKEAKFEMRRREQADAAANDGAPDMFPLPFLDHAPNSHWLKKMEESAKRDELESRFRSRIREEKLKSSKLLKAAVPDMGGAIVDPIKRHVFRRLVRQRVKMKAGLEEILTSNTAQILYEFMKGVAISIVRIRSKRPRETQEILYTLSSNHDPVWVQERLAVLAPKLRSQLALKVNFGQTPNIRFVPIAKEEDAKRKHLWKHGRQILRQIPVGGGYGSAVGVG